MQNYNFYAKLYTVYFYCSWSVLTKILIRLILPFLQKKGKKRERKKKKKKDIVCEYKMDHKLLINIYSLRI